MNHTPHTLALIFLDPAAGIVAASLALPALLLLYFLKLRRRPVRISSTLLWDRAVEDLQVNTPFRWLRPSLLLLLQVLALTLLAGALGRPALLDPGAPPTGRLIILIDRSASMSAADGDESGSTRLEAAKKAAAELTRRLRADQTEAMVVSFATEPRIEAPYTTSAGLLNDAIEGVSATDQPADLDAALAVVRAFAGSAGEDSEAVPTTLYLFSDGDLPPTAPEAAGAIGSAGLLFRRVGPAPDAPRDNLGIVAISARRDEADPNLLRLFARVQSTSAEPIETALTVRLDDAPASAAPLSIPAADESGPAELPVTITFPAPAGGLVVATIARADGLSADNTAALVAAPPSDRSAWLVSAGAPNADLREALALMVSAPEALRTLSLAEYERALPLAPTPPDLLIFDRVRPTALPPIPSISIGATLPIPGLGVTDASEPRATRFLTWRRTHPLLRDVVLDAVIVQRPLTLTLPEEQPSVASTVLAQGDDGPLIALLEQGAVSRVVIAFDLDASTWPLSYSFPIFIANAVETLTGAGASGIARAYRTTEPITLRAGADTRTIELRGPLELTVPVRDADRSAALGALPLAGVYTAQGATERDSLLAVNLADAAESRIGSADAVEIAGAPATGGEGAIGTPREIWFWFVLGAASLLTVEWFLFAWQMRV